MKRGVAGNRCPLTWRRNMSITRNPDHHQTLHHLPRPTQIANHFDPNPSLPVLRKVENTQSGFVESAKTRSTSWRRVHASLLAIRVFPMQVCNPLPTPTDFAVREVTKIARTHEEWLAAYRLAYENYLRKGLVSENIFGIRVTPFHLLPETTTFVSLQDSEQVATVTLIGDSSDGIPMESIFPNQVAQIRDEGATFGEVSSLASRPMPTKEFLQVYLKLMRLMAQYARSVGMERFLMVVHPRHVPFYKRMMGFRMIGETRSYPTVCGAPAVPCQLEFAEVDRTRPPFYDAIFGEDLPSEALRRHPMPEHARKFFEPATAVSKLCVPTMV
ncbi:hypothetical protein Mal4_03420 [Maioricimonas rarisocia]|uniref:N-acyl amino acid synthase FeeM catalytic core domain-containing protein n=2 Tax=Maioricimonas rarisocia TaxID=2528026 RepID=A0A517Z0W6_9PLAN|nr:hypothetical protein Mal4_03420 [Maioricimonas rarisocia]